METNSLDNFIKLLDFMKDPLNKSPTDLPIEIEPKHHKVSQFDLQSNTEEFLRVVNSEIAQGLLNLSNYKRLDNLTLKKLFQLTKEVLIDNPNLIREM